MKWLRHVVLIAFGTLIGAFAWARISDYRVRAADPNRLFFIEAAANTGTSGLVFIRDNRSGGCWLGIDVRDQGITSVASAPSTACQR